MIKIISSLLLMSSAVLADVNMRDAAFLKTMNEFSNPLFERTYSSRSLWNGLFGFGWCSNLEHRLEVISPEKGLLKKCDRQFPVSISKKNNRWLYQGSQGSEIYDQDGRLVSLTPSKTDLIYDSKGRLSSVKTAKETFNIEYQKDGPKIRKILSTRSGSVTFRHEDENLISIEAGSQKVSLVYDAFHNLTEIRGPLSQESINYQSELDEVASYRSSLNDCLETYTFRKVSTFELKSTVEKKCPSASLQLRTYSFIARRNPQGRLTLKDVKTVGGLNDKTNLP